MKDLVPIYEYKLIDLTGLVDEKREEEDRNDGDEHIISELINDLGKEGWEIPLDTLIRQRNFWIKRIIGWRKFSDTLSDK